MNWEVIGASGEWAGAIAVVATLFYLARQISQNSEALDRANAFAQSSSLHDTQVLYSELWKIVATDKELASIYDRALKTQPLDEIEAVRFNMLVRIYFTWLEDIYYQQAADLGFAVEGGTERLLATVGPFYKSLLSVECARTWWLSDAKHHFTPDFITAIQESLNDA